MTNCKGQPVNGNQEQPQQQAKLPPSPPFVIDEAKAQKRESEVFEIVSQSLQYYRPEDLLMAFNGGKDGAVMLHVLARYYKQRCLQHIRIPVLYIRSKNAFEELEPVIEECAKLYNIEMIVRCGDIRIALADVCRAMPHIKGVFMGCRRVDPNCHDTTVMQPTTEGWPPLMRINPIIDWTCYDIWNYIFIHNVPYCSLYDQGYTSLGNKTNTRPNPHLRRVNHATGEVTYGRAYELADSDHLERAGRL